MPVDLEEQKHMAADFDIVDGHVEVVDRKQFAAVKNVVVEAGRTVVDGIEQPNVQEQQHIVVDVVVEA